MPAWRDFSVRNVNAPEEPSTRRTASFALGYEDCNDAATLRRDPVLKVCCDRDPFSDPDLASQPTLSRLEDGAGPKSCCTRSGVVLPG